MSSPTLLIPSSPQEPKTTGNENNNWTLKKEKLLIKWRQQSRVYHWLHAKASAHKNFWHSIIFYTSLFLASLGIAQNFGTLYAGDDSDTTEENKATIRGLMIADGIITAMIAFLNMYLKTSKIAELGEKHKNTSKEFVVLRNEIDEQMAQTREDRENGKTYLKKIRIKLTAHIKDSPEIPQNIWKKFSEAVKNGEIFNESDPTFYYGQAERTYKKNMPRLDSLTSGDSYQSPSYRKKPSYQSPTSPHHVTLQIKTPEEKDTNGETKEETYEEEKNEEEINEEIERTFSRTMHMTGRLNTNITKALEYQMDRFN